LTRLTDILTTKRKIITTEFLPPNHPELTELIQATLKVASAVDCISIPEIKANYNIPKHRMNPLHVAIRIRDLTGVETLFHLTPRDYNKNAIAGILLAAAESKLHNLLVIGGDRYTYEETLAVARNVYDFVDSVEMIRGIRHFENEFNLNSSQRFFVAAGTDPSILHAHDKIKLEKEMSRLLGRQDAGADAVQTQPVFDLSCLEFIDHAREHGIKLPFMLGLLPLRSESDADYIEKRFAIMIPRDYKISLKDHSDGETKTCELALELQRNGISWWHIYPRQNPDFVLRVADALNTGSLN